VITSFVEGVLASDGTILVLQGDDKRTYPASALAHAAIVAKVLVASFEGKASLPLEGLRCRGVIQDDYWLADVELIKVERA
jgi:hypothetical protein